MCIENSPTTNIVKVDGSMEKQRIIVPVVINPVANNTPLRKPTTLQYYLRYKV